MVRGRFPVAIPLWIPAYAGMTVVLHASPPLRSAKTKVKVLKFVPIRGCGMGFGVAT